MVCSQLCSVGASCSFCSFVQVKACILCIHPRTRVVRLSLRPVFLQPGRPLTRISYQQLGAVLDKVPVQGFFKKAGATFRLKDGALAYARVRRLLYLVKDLIPGKTLGKMGPFLLPSTLDINSQSERLPLRSEQ